MILQAGLKYKCVTSTRKSTTCILPMKQLRGHTHGLAKKSTIWYSTTASILPFGGKPVFQIRRR